MMVGGASRTVFTLSFMMHERSSAEGEPTMFKM